MSKYEIVVNTKSNTLSIAFTTAMFIAIVNLFSYTQLSDKLILIISYLVGTSGLLLLTRQPAFVPCSWRGRPLLVIVSSMAGLCIYVFVSDSALSKLALVLCNSILMATAVEGLVLKCKSVAEQVARICAGLETFVGGSTSRGDTFTIQLSSTDKETDPDAVWYKITLVRERPSPVFTLAHFRVLTVDRQTKTGFNSYARTNSKRPMSVFSTIYAIVDSLSENKLDTMEVTVAQEDV